MLAKRHATADDTYMNITFLGTGTGCSTERGAAANYLEIGVQKLLVDFGPGGLRQLARAGKDYREIDMVCISHIHTDHVLDVAALLQALYWAPDYVRTKPLTLIGPVGFKKYMQRYLMPIAELPRPTSITFERTIVELHDQLECDGFSISCGRTVHDRENASIAYRFTEGSSSLVVSGDCTYTPELVDFCRDTHTLLLECSYPDQIANERHLHAGECGRIARDAHVRQLFLTHLHPTASVEERLQQAQSVFPRTKLAEELQTIVV